MCGVIAGCEHGGEVVAGSEMHVVQKALLFGRAVTLLNSDPASVRQRESRDVDGITERVLGEIPNRQIRPFLGMNRPRSA